MDYKVIYVFLSIMLSINVVMVGTRIYQTSDLTGPFSALFTNLDQESVKSGDAQLDQITVDVNSTSSDNYDQLPMYKSGTFLSGFSTLLYLVSGIIFGYTAFLNAINTPYLISLLVIVMITLFGTIATVFMIKDVWTAIWGVR